MRDSGSQRLRAICIQQLKQTTRGLGISHLDRRCRGRCVARCAREAAVLSQRPLPRRTGAISPHTALRERHRARGVPVDSLKAPVSRSRMPALPHADIAATQKSSGSTGCMRRYCQPCLVKCSCVVNGSSIIRLTVYWASFLASASATNPLPARFICPNSSPCMT